MENINFFSAEQIGLNTVLHGLSFFDLAQTLDCGQAFRWSKSGENGEKFTGIAHGRRVNIFFEKNNLILENISLQEFETTWKNYFDLNRDYENLREFLKNSPNSETLCKALEFSPGLRLMRQDAWEVLISFILSQNSNIPRIKKMIESLCENFGEKLPCGGFAFPSPEKLASLNETDLAPIRCGYRSSYISDAARRVADGSFNPHELQKLSSDEIHNALLQIRGVGPKVAECVLLYGFGRVERFPIDVWIKRVMSQFYPQGFPHEIKNFSGIAQQFLFHYIRQI
jgi:N-glycosylase/DNA lyase